jgi:hypothetical protein
MSKEERQALVDRLLSLVARLEEEMFHSEAQKFEAEVVDEIQAFVTL